MPQVITLDKQSLLTYWAPVFTPEKADDILQKLLAQVEWERPTLTLYGKSHPIPRLASWYGDAAYRYSGKKFSPHPWTPLLLQLKQTVEHLTGQHYNSVLCNCYRDGNDSMGWHSDDEPELGKQPWIASLSLGAQRDFSFRRKGETRQHQTVPLAHNSLLLMAPAVQHQWQHAIPKRKRVQHPRINLTFRWVGLPCPSP